VVKKKRGEGKGEGQVGTKHANDQMEIIGEGGGQTPSICPASGQWGGGSTETKTGGRADPGRKKSARIGQKKR